MTAAPMYREIAEDPAADLPVAQEELTAQPVDLIEHVRFDVCPTWLELAIRHFSDAQVAQAARISAWRGTDENSKSGALEWEFETSLQSIMACSIALDAFCAAVQSRVHLPPSVVDQSRERRLPRHAEMSEIFRFAFSLSAKEAGSLRQNLGEIFRFRDLAIDASSKSGAPVLHPELHAAGEWRFAYFRCENTALIVRATLRLIRSFVVSDKPKDADVQKYLDGLKPRLERLLYSNALRAQGPTGRT